jgi:hypothetical protein
LTELDRAVRLAALPGMSLAAASRRTGLPIGALRKARTARPPRIDRDDLLLGALTDNGLRLAGPIPDAAQLAGWLDYVNHDGSTADEVARDLARLADAGILALDAGEFRLLVPWP